jgi:hypothetical protein
MVWPAKSGSSGKVDSAEFLSAVGTFLAAAMLDLAWAATNNPLAAPAIASPMRSGYEQIFLLWIASSSPTDSEGRKLGPN